MVQIGFTPEGDAPLVGCPRKKCRFTAPARVGTELYRSIVKRDGRLALSKEKLEKEVRKRVAETLRKEFPHATLGDLSEVAKRYPDMTLAEILGLE